MNRRNPQRARGSILVIVMFVMVVLSFVALSFAYRAGVQRRLAIQSSVQLKLRHQARSAVAIAIARLAENTNEWDHRFEDWHRHAPLGVEGWISDWADPDTGEPPVYTADYQVVDEQSKLNVLYASSEAMRKLGLDDVQIDSLFDWMDADEDQRPFGAESEYYLQRAEPTHAKNQPLEAIEELLVIRGFDIAGYIGEDANHNQVLDANENDGGVNPPADDADGRLDLGWVDLLTCATDGRINLNTTPIDVLAVLPLSDGAAGQIVAYRLFDERSEGALEDHVFTSLADVEQLQGIEASDVDVLSTIATFRSTHFRVHAWAEHAPTRTRHAATVLVRAEGQDLQIVSWYREP